MYAGGLKETPYQTMLDKNPDQVRVSLNGCDVSDRNVYLNWQVIRQAVSGMLPKNKLRERRLERLKIFPSYQMGKVGANILRTWEDGTLPPDFDPCRPTTALTLQKLQEQRLRPEESLIGRKGLSS